MKLVDIKYKKFSFPLNPPIQNSFTVINQKDFLILQAIDENENIHYGEVSPLIGFSKESLKECEQNLKELIALNILSDKIENLKVNLRSLVKHPSLLFGLEQLLLSTEINGSLKNHPVNNRIKLNALVDIKDGDSTVNDIRSLVKLGYGTIKLKIGRENFKDDLKVLDTINDEFNNSIKFRLDNNGSWKYDEAIENIKLLEKFNIEYIEQPVINTEELLSLAEVSKKKLAADESLTSFDEAKRIIKSRKINYFVLKPAIRIGVFDTLKLIELAKKNNIRIIISSAFETIIGRHTLFYLALMASQNLAHGLGTQLLGESIFGTKINLSSPVVDCTKIFSPITMSEDIF